MTNTVSSTCNTSVKQPSSALFFIPEDTDSDDVAINKCKVESDDGGDTSYFPKPSGHVAPPNPAAVEETYVGNNSVVAPPHVTDYARQYDDFTQKQHAMSLNSSLYLNSDPNNMGSIPSFAEQKASCQAVSSSYENPALPGPVSSSNDETTFPCTICEKVFRRNCHLVNHMRSHNPGGMKDTQRNERGANQSYNDSKPIFTCNVCNKTFLKKGTLKLHSRIHQKNKPFACAICGKTFNYKCNLLSHQLTHKDNGAKPFQCEVCNKQFSYKGSLKYHREKCFPPSNALQFI